VFCESTATLYSIVTTQLWGRHGCNVPDSRSHAVDCVFSKRMSQT